MTIPFDSPLPFGLPSYFDVITEETIADLAHSLYPSHQFIPLTIKYIRNLLIVVSSKISDPIGTNIPRMIVKCRSAFSGNLGSAILEVIHAAMRENPVAARDVSRIAHDRIIMYIARLLIRTTTNESPDVKTTCLSIDRSIYNDTDLAKIFSAVVPPRCLVLGTSIAVPDEQAFMEAGWEEGFDESFNEEISFMMGRYGITPDEEFLIPVRNCITHMTYLMLNAPRDTFTAWLDSISIASHATSRPIATCRSKLIAVILKEVNRIRGNSTVVTYNTAVHGILFNHHCDLAPYLQVTHIDALLA